MRHDESSPLVAPDRDAKQLYYIGIDLGGTNTAYGVVCKDGKIIIRGSVPTRGHSDAEAFADALTAAIERDLRQAGISENIRAIGIGAPCANSATGCMEGFTEIDWESPVPLQRLVEQRMHRPVRITNDANAAAAGEMAFGAARGIRNFIEITLGTGVGAGIVVDGRLLNGSRGFAGELGHVTMGGDRMCGCGRKGCLQMYCNSEGIVRTAREILASDPALPSPLRHIIDRITPRDIFEAALTGDQVAIRTFGSVGRHLGEACANFAAYTDPEAIILFGGIAGAGDFIIDPMREAMERNILHLYRGRIRILTSSLPGSDAPILGAAGLWAAGQQSS